MAAAVVSEVAEMNDGDRSTMAVAAPQKKNRIQVSNNKKSLYFYVNLAKRYMQQHNEIELSVLGMAIGTVVTVAEILKNNGLATEKKILTSTVGTKDETKGKLIRKAKIEILMGKSDKFDDMMSANKMDGGSKVADADEEKKERVLISSMPHVDSDIYFVPLVVVR